MELNLLELIGITEVTKQDAIICLNYWQKYFGGKGLFGIVKNAAETLHESQFSRYLVVELRVFEPYETGEGKQVVFLIYYKNSEYIECTTMLNDTSVNA